jgi:hypothetical protein
LRGNVDYISGTTDFFDNCNTQTFSLLLIHEFISFFGYEIDGFSVYWRLPDKELTDGLYCIESDAHIVAMCAAAKEHKNLNILVDHTGFLKSLRNDVLVRPN